MFYFFYGLLATLLATKRVHSYYCVRLYLRFFFRLIRDLIQHITVQTIFIHLRKTICSWFWIDLDSELGRNSGRTGTGSCRNYSGILGEICSFLNKNYLNADKEYLIIILLLLLLQPKSRYLVTNFLFSYIIHIITETTAD